MPIVMMCKLPFKTKKFNKNQKVWVVSTSGAQAFKVCGRFRGKWRYVTAWVNWCSNAKETPKWKKFNVDKQFVDTHNLLTFTD
jgi:hypothetical protein